MNKFLSSCGICSRRQADELIQAGRVKLNGVVVVQPGLKVDPHADVVEVDGQRVEPQGSSVIVAMYKPKGVLSTCRDPFGRPTVLDVLEQSKVRVPGRVYPVGRLDKDSEGLILLTNDGELANILMHPRYGVKKVYLAQVRGVPTSHALEALKNGVSVEGAICKAAEVKLLSAGRQRAELELVMHEGRKREIRLMCQAIGHPVLNLKRVQIGPVRLGQMQPGEVRSLTPEELASIRQLKKGRPTR
ncbi:MAG: pseudouridine synthase [Bacillota bacterium]